MGASSAKIAGAVKVYNRGIQGKIKYSDDNLPDVERKVNIFVKDLFGVQHYVGKAKTDNSGFFQFNYNWQENWLSSSHDVVIGIIEKRRPFAEKGLWCAKEEVVVDRINVSLPKTPAFVDIGEKAITYDDIPNNLAEVKKPPITQTQSPYYYWKFFKAAFPEAVKRVCITILQRWLSTAQVQKIYDSFGPAYSKHALTPNNLIFELMNEICAVDYQLIDDQVTWTANWDGLEFDTENSLPNVEVVANKNERGELILQSIAVQFRGDPAPTVIHPGDEKMDWAIYVARSTFALKGEAEVHLAEGHVLPGIPAKAFFKYIKPSNPIFAPVAPHISQLEFINYLGSQGVIFGKGSVLDVSALTDTSIAEVIVNSMLQKSNYLNYAPHEPINNQHYLAMAERKHYELLKGFFIKYVADNRAGIHSHWDQIYNWSEVMSKHLATLPKITNSPSNPTYEDEKKLALLLAWLVNKTTFIHWAAHSRQQLLTDVRCASLGIRNRALDANGGFAASGNTPPIDASQQNFIARFLLNFEGDSFLKNPYGDINQELLALIKQHKDEYVGYSDIDKMHMTTQI